MLHCERGGLGRGKLERSKIKLQNWIFQSQRSKIIITHLGVTTMVRSVREEERDESRRDEEERREEESGDL